MLRYFAALLPPQEIQDKIESFLDSVSLPHAAASTPGHIKVITKEGLDPYAPWEEVAKNVAASTKPFTVQFGKPQFLGEYLLAIPITSPELVEAHNKSVKEMVTKELESLGKSTDELGAFYENQSLFTPYLTLAAGMFGKETFMGSNPEKKKILRKATKLLSNLPSFTASELTLYEATVFDRTYEPTGVLPLGVTDAPITHPAGLPQVSLA